MEQISLFEDEIIVPTDSSSKNASEGEETKLFAKEFRYLSEQLTSIEELFAGYNTIRIISFSTGLPFINDLLSMFDYGEILIGSSHLVNKKDIQKLISQFAVEYDFVATESHRHSELLRKIKNEDAYLKVVKNMVHHEKLYLLESDDGRYRVIYSSANATNKAWSGEQGEFFNYCDDEELYFKELDYFTTVWNEAVPVEKNNIVAPSNQKESPFLNHIKKEIETKELFVVAEANDEEALTRVKYSIHAETKSEEYQKILKGIKGTKKKGTINILYKELKKIYKKNKERVVREKKIKEVDHGLPKIKVLDQDEQDTILLDNKENSLEKRSLIVPEDKLKESVQAYLELMETYNNELFEGDVEVLKQTHFKVLTLLFGSVFHSRLRIEANFNNLSIDALPLFITLTSIKSNSGKTFMIRAILKMMSGITQDVIKAKDFSVTNLKALVATDKPYLPILIDEMEAANIKYYKGIMKASSSQASLLQYNHPIFIFTGNKLSLEDSIRKRTPIFFYASKLGSHRDENKMKSLGNAIIDSLSTEFYFEYLRRMIPLVNEEIDYLSSKERPIDYYPTLVTKSSKIIIEIIKDCGFEVPTYMKELNWVEDFSANSNSILAVVKNEMLAELKTNPSAFKVNNGKAYINLPKNADNEKMVKRWQELLPNEIHFTELTSKISGTYLFSLDKHMLKEHLGIDLGRNKLPFINWFKKK